LDPHINAGWGFPACAGEWYETDEYTLSKIMRGNEYLWIQNRVQGIGEFFRKEGLFWFMEEEGCRIA